MSTVRKTLSAAAVAGSLAAAAVASVCRWPPLSRRHRRPDWVRSRRRGPRRTAEAWDSQPVVWTSAWGGRWGVWINDGFIPLTSNPVTNGG